MGFDNCTCTYTDIMHVDYMLPIATAPLVSVMACTAAFGYCTSGECHGVHCYIATAPLVSVMVCTAAFSGECHGVHCCILW